MGRLPRVYVNNAIYHITSTSSHSQGLFCDPFDYKEYTSLLVKYKEQHGFKLFAYALMPNHLHLLIELQNNVPISTIMHNINSLYTKLYNGRYGKKGHLFQERFKALLAEKGPFLLPIIRDIHLSPVLSKDVDHPNYYPYSSHQLYLEASKRQFTGEYPDMTVEVNEVMEILGGGETGRAKYEKYVVEADMPEVMSFRKSIYKKRLIGSKDFTDRVNRAIEIDTKKRKKDQVSRKAQILYLVFGGAALIVFAITATIFYSQTNVLKNKYDRTADLYKRTLKMLESEKNKAMKAEKNVEEYAWKIELTENALEKIMEEKEKELREEMKIEGYAWKVQLTRINGSGENISVSDLLTITDKFVSSEDLLGRGYGRSAYSKREGNNGAVIWETMQTDGRGGMANWRGEWDGKEMRGIVRRKDADGVTRDFTFINSGERTRISE